MRNILFLFCCCVLYATQLAAQETGNFMVFGYVYDSLSMQPLAGVTVGLLQSDIKTLSKDDGSFSLPLTRETDVLSFACTGYKKLMQQVGRNDNPLTIFLTMSPGNLQTVVVNTGYQHISRERGTGSYNYIDKQLISRSVSPGILTRIENLAPGLLFNHGDAAKGDAFTIRGRSTIYANASPLIVLDNFPYDGDINNINPNDVESITLLKDAAAASIWGARAGNGVIVITTKKGKTAKPVVEFSANTTIAGRPDLFNISQVSGSDYVLIEKFLFDNGYYNWMFTDSYHTAAPPAATLLHAAASGEITGEEAEAAIASMQQHDVRNDLKKYFYRNSLNQQYALNVSGKTEKTSYYFSAGYDKAMAALKGKGSERVSLRSMNSFKPFKGFEMEEGVNITLSANRSGKNDGYDYSSPLQGRFYYPYAKLADDKGNALPVYIDYSKTFTDTAGGGRLPDWTSRPLDDIDAQVNTVKIADYTVFSRLSYAITQHLQIDIKYQFEYQQTTNKTYYGPDAFYSRNLINNFTQLNFTTNATNYVIPKGAVQDAYTGSLASHQGRAQLSFSKGRAAGRHQLNAIAGFEIKSTVSEGSANRIYGYDKEHNTINGSIDYKNYYPQYSNPGSRRIPNNSYLDGATDHFISYYANAGYSFRQLYDLTGSIRIDEANLFGAEANQKGTPLWSAGAAWKLSNEPFYHIHWLPYLKLRVTYGCNGNISRVASAYATILYNTAVVTNTPVAIITNPANPALHWERTSTFNAGTDFATRNDRFSGSIEFYSKNSSGLLGSAPLDPTSGIGSFIDPSYYGNVAAMKGKGADIQLNTVNIDHGLTWRTGFIFSWAATKVTHSYVPESNTGANYVYANSINPVLNRPLFSLYSYAWGGLDASNGNPQGYLNGKINEDYSSIYSGTPVDNMVYNGPAQPVFYGALRNDIGYKGFSLSFNISYKLDYYFRTASVNYGSLYAAWNGNGDFAKRWQKPGDEKITHVPSMSYPANYYRDFFYQYSAALVANAGNVRLEDINLSYMFPRKTNNKSAIQSLRLFIYVSNVGILWKANRFNVDPYYNNIAREGRSFSTGITISF